MVQLFYFWGENIAVLPLLCFLNSQPNGYSKVGGLNSNKHTYSFSPYSISAIFFSFLGSYLKQTRIPFCDISARRDVAFCSFLNLTYFKGKRGAVSHLHFALISQRDRKPLHLRRQFSPNYGDAVSCGWKKKSR